MSATSPKYAASDSRGPPLREVVEATGAGVGFADSVGRSVLRSRSSICVPVAGRAGPAGLGIGRTEIRCHYAFRLCALGPREEEHHPPWGPSSLRVPFDAPPR